MISVYFCQLRIKYHVIRALAETCYGCLRGGKINTKLEVLSFGKAREEIEIDILSRALLCGADGARGGLSIDCTL